jgi:hypothetical protein
MIERFEILFVEIAAPRQKQDRSTRPGRGGPVDPAQRVAVRRVPAALARAGRNAAAVESVGRVLLNGNLSGVVTIW